MISVSTLWDRVLAAEKVGWFGTMHPPVGVAAAACMLGYTHRVVYEWVGRKPSRSMPARRLVQRWAKERDVPCIIPSLMFNRKIKRFLVTDMRTEGLETFAWPDVNWRGSLE